MLDTDKVRRLQAHVGVTADGSFGPQTLDATLRALGLAEPVAVVTSAIREAVRAFGASVAGILAADDRYLPLFQVLASPQADPETVKAMARSFADHAPAYGQGASKARIAEFVAQIANETGGFTRFSENLNYSTEGLLNTFGRHRISAEDAQRYGRNAQHPANKEMIANTIYGGEWGAKNLGNTEPGDGYRYRGRGALQLTGRSNFRHYGQALGLDLEGHPELAADPAVSVQIALEFFKQGDVNAAIDRGDFAGARKITNGGNLGLENVARLRAKALQELG